MGVLFVGKPFYLERAVGHSSTSACAYYFLNICLPEVFLRRLRSLSAYPVESIQIRYVALIESTIVSSKLASKLFISNVNMCTIKTNNSSISWKHHVKSSLIQNDKKCSNIGSGSSLGLLLLDDLPSLRQALIVSLTSFWLDLIDSNLVVHASLFSTMDDTVM